MDDNARILAEIAQRMAALPEEEQQRILDELQKRLDKGRIGEIAAAKGGADIGADFAS